MNLAKPSYSLKKLAYERKWDLNKFKKIEFSLDMFSIILGVGWVEWWQYKYFEYNYKLQWIHVFTFFLDSWPTYGGKKELIQTCVKNSVKIDTVIVLY